MGRVSLCLALAFVVSLLAAATALAGGGASIRVGAPFTFCGPKAHGCSDSHTIHGNDEYEAQITGHAPKGADVVAGFDGHITCKSRYTAEKHAYSIDEQLQGGASVSGTFKVLYESAAYLQGTDTICVYLIHNSTGKTYAHASRKFTVLPEPQP
jgi:hypothetical protein